MSQDKKYAQISNESISAWAETIGVTDLPADVLYNLGSDVTYRLHQLIQGCSKYLSHCNRKRLTTDDINKGLNLIDAPPVYGHSGNESVEWNSAPDLGVFITRDPVVNLASTALSGDIFHQPGNTYVKGKWEHIIGHISMKTEGNAGVKSFSSIPLSPQLVQYYRTLFAVVTNPSNKLFKTMCEDVSTSPNLNPIVGYILRGVLNGADKARYKPMVLWRLLNVIRAIVFNPFIHLGPQSYIDVIVNVLVFCIVLEHRTPLATQCMKTFASNILLGICLSDRNIGSAWNLAVRSLAGVIHDPKRAWTQHSGALIGLIPLGFIALYQTLIQSPLESFEKFMSVKVYYSRLCATLSKSPASLVISPLLNKDYLDANLTVGLLLTSFVNMMVSLIKMLPENLNSENMENQVSDDTPETQNEGNMFPSLDIFEPMTNTEIVEKLSEIYSLGAEMFGPAFVLQLPSIYLYSDDKNSNKLPFMGYSPDCSRSPTSESFYPSIKKRKIESLINPNACIPLPLSRTFINFKNLIPLEKRKIFMCIRGCSTRKFEYLKQKRSSLPQFRPHQYRSLLIRYSASKMTGRMPHWTFLKPVKHSPKPFSLNFIFI